MTNRVVVVGNGGVGSLISIQVKMAFPTYEVTLIGPEARPGAASAAAGAMANVIAEVEHPFDGNSHLTDWLVAIGLRSRAKWLKFFESHRASDIVTCNDTLVYLAKGASDFERRNFEFMLQYTDQERLGQEVETTSLKDKIPTLAELAERMVILRGEFAYDSARTLKLLDAVAASLGVRRINEFCSLVDTQKMEVVTSSEATIAFDRAIVAAGAVSAQLLPAHPILPMLQGVGSAFVIDASGPIESLGGQVIRTVNRGGAQCGFHTVPRADGSLYLGAGNYITHPGDAHHRLETLRYLFSVFERELLSQDEAYPLTGRPVLGKRPRGLDGFPLVGVLNSAPEVAVVTGMNRVGFTWAPEFADEVVKWVAEKDDFSAYAQWSPEREPIAYGTDEVALDYFVESRLAAALEHGRVARDHHALEQKSSELRQVGRLLQLEVRTVLDMHDGYSITPDHWNPLTQVFSASCER